MTHQIAILGASGYTGAELVRLIATHPTLQIAALSADRKAGMAMADVFPHLRHLDLPKLVTIDQIDFAGIDLVFCALPHATSQAVIKDLPEAVKVVDLSADFRLFEIPAEENFGSSSRPQNDALCLTCKTNIETKVTVAAIEIKIVLPPVLSMIRLCKNGHPASVQNRTGPAPYLLGISITC